jgi:type VI protein secretion system component VasK
MWSEEVYVLCIMCLCVCVCVCVCVCRLYNDARDKVNACERKKESHDEKSRRKDEIKREIEKLEQENRNRIQQVPKLYTLTHIP